MFQDQEFCLLFATLVIHYWKNSGFNDGKNIIDNMNVIENIPTTLIHGRLDISSPVQIAWNVHNFLANSSLIIIDDEGHGGEIMISKLRSAINEFSFQ
jgi:proline iminopeptidase